MSTKIKFKEYRATFLGITRLKDWPCFKWSIELPDLSEPIEYHTGLGHATTKRGEQGLKAIRVNEAQFIHEVRKAHPKIDNWNTLYLNIPTIESVAECLQTDKQCGEMSFYDFCDEFGYNRDSIEHLKLHMQLMEMAQRLRGFDFNKYLPEEMQA